MHPLPGTYALVLPAASKKSIEIGKIGAIEIKSGFYLYVGSAFGPGGVKARIKHHVKKSSRPHWHIDYLTANLPPDEVWYSYDRKHREHQWVKVLAGVKGASIPLDGFGASDCKCSSHLFSFATRLSANSFRRKIRRKYANHDRIFILKLSALKTAVPDG